MNFNVWNIREMLSIPTGTGANKTSSRNSAPSDYSSLTDSQFLFGSQFCPENSQSTLQEYSLQSKAYQNSQQNSQDIEPNFYTKYQRKPSLFGVDNKQKSSVPNFGGKPRGILEKFEISKKKTKDDNESDSISSLISQTQECMQGMQRSLSQCEEKVQSGTKTILDGLEKISKTVQENSDSHYGSILSALTARSNVEQALLEMEKQLATKDTDISELKSGMQVLQEGLEVLKTQQNVQYQTVCEHITSLTKQLEFSRILDELQKLASTFRPGLDVRESTSQTSPSNSQNPCLACEENKYQAMRVHRASSGQTKPDLALCQLEHTELHTENWLAKDTYQTCSEMNDLNSAAAAEQHPVTLRHKNVTCEKRMYIERSRGTSPHYDLRCQAHIITAPPGSNSSIQISQCIYKEQVSVSVDPSCSRPKIGDTQKGMDQRPVTNLKVQQQKEIGGSPICYPEDQNSADLNNHNEKPSATKTWLQNTFEKNTDKKNGNHKKKTENRKAMKKKRYLFTKKKRKKNVSVENQGLSVKRKMNVAQKEFNPKFLKHGSVSPQVRKEQKICVKEKSVAKAVLGLCSPQDEGLPVVKEKEMMDNHKLDITRTERTFSQLELSSQDNCEIQDNSKHENKMTWFSPLSPVFYMSYPALQRDGLKKEHGKIRSHMYVLDSSDESD
nr:PREDICTED: coiled-coil domain-containing protein 36 isoform X2 [Latimeria chalumnae]|eukprot:XP_014350196.1 PREDICTED: coiled-coil domain-containing protein 36 isoform X2 [Latimeria chalumnae]